MKLAQMKRTVGWDWMRDRGISITPDSPIKEAVALMNKHSIHHLLVFEGKKYVGVLSSRDCVLRNGGTVRDHMRTDVPVLEEQSEVRDALRWIIELHCTAVPVKTDGEVKTLITSTDLLNLLAVHLENEGKVSDVIRRGANILSKPVFQSVMDVLGKAGI